MTVEEIRSHYGSAKKFIKITGIAQTNFYNWKRWGYVPYKAQFKIQEITQGKLIARLEDGKMT